MCFKFTIKTKERRHYRRLGAFVETFEPIQVINMVFWLLNMKMYLHGGLSQDFNIPITFTIFNISKPHQPR